MTVSGRKAIADLLRMLAEHVESGVMISPPAIYPAPHLGPMAVRIGGVDYNLGSDDTDDTEPDASS